MKFQLPDTSFPPLVLSAYEQQELIDEADRIIEETIAAQEKYIARGRRVPEHRWKHLRCKEGINVYRQRGVGGSKKLFDALDGDDERRDAQTVDSVTSYDTPSSAWKHLLAHAKTPGAPSSARTPSSMFGFRSAKTPSTRRQPMSTKDIVMLEEPSGSSPTHSTDDTVASGDHWWMREVKPAHIPALVAVGVIDGTLEDAMYGVFCQDDASWRWKSSQINDKLDDARVLTTIRGPTKDDPFRFIGVKWFTKEHPSALQSIVKRRDFLVIEAMGTTYDSSGTVKLGYFMMHSINIPRIPELTELDILRGNVSMCFILRQANAYSTEIYARGFSDPVGEMLESVSVRLASESMLAAIRIVDFAHIKKLRWLMINRKDTTRNTQLCVSGETICKTCKKSVNRLSSFLQGSSTCQVCHDVICARCTVNKQITIDITNDGPTQKPLPFCLSCVMEAKNLSAFDVALVDVKQKQYDLLPADLFAPKPKASDVERTAGVRRVSTAPKLRKAHSSAAMYGTGNSRTRSASHITDQSSGRRQQAGTVLYP